MQGKDTLDSVTVDVWKEAIEVQMHFNQLLIRVRALLASVILALSGAISLLRRTPGSDVGVHECALLVAIGFVGAHFLLDFFYYTRLLLGAVDFTARLDKERAMGSLSGLTESITRAAPRWLTLWLIIVYYALLVLVLFATYFHVRGHACLSCWLWGAAVLLFAAALLSGIVIALRHRPLARPDRLT